VPPDQYDEIYDSLRAAETAMFEERFEDAAAHYRRLLALNLRDHHVSPFWVRMALGESWFRRESWSEALDEYRGAFAEDNEAAVGNPLFHLRVGQCLFQLTSPGGRLETGSGTAMDSLARALICGGVELFDDESPEYLAAIGEVLLPPADVSSWQETRGRGGATRDKLEGADRHEFLWEMLESRGLVKSFDVKAFLLNPKYWKSE
jgi:hypothetical protein